MWLNSCKLVSKLFVNPQIKLFLSFKVLNAVNVEYAQLSRYQSESGGFSNWIGSELSVWLTAHALRNLWIANFQVYRLYHLLITIFRTILTLNSLFFWNDCHFLRLSRLVFGLCKTRCSVHIGGTNCFLF